MNINQLPFVYFCSGARNQALLNLFNRDSLKFEIDERIASFKALGFAKSTNLPIAVCTTSGTAVSECLSSMIEAFYSQTPLLLISADRPQRLQKTGAPQTINHEIITREYRRTYLELSLIELWELDLSQLSYPAHINVLIENESEKDSSSIISYQNTMEGFKLFVENHPRPLILLSHEPTSMRDFAHSLLSTQIPFYAETLSQAHDLAPIKYEMDLIKFIRDGFFTSVLRIGHTPLSKSWRMLESFHLPCFSFDSRGLAGISYGSIINQSSQNLMENESWWRTITNIKDLGPIETSESKFNQLLKKYPDSEMAYLSKLQEFIPNESIVYLGNSLTIRFFEMIQTKKYSIYANRGANGIDGQLATAIGIAESRPQTVYCILGDLTTQYDLTSLKNIPPNLKLIIINNNGGRIFDIMKMKKELVMEEKFNFEPFVKAYGLSYAKNHFEFFSNYQVFEINPSNEETTSFMKEWES